METLRRQSQNVVLVGVIALVLGVLFGWIVLGWWIWPVDWEDAAAENMASQYQEDYLRMAIDSFSLNQDDQLALMRYESLGETAESTLETIQSDPGDLSPAAISGFTAVVQAGEAQVAENPSWVTLLVIALVIGLVCFLFYWFLLRGLVQDQAAEAPLEPAQPETVMWWEAPPEEEIPAAADIGAEQVAVLEEAPAFPVEAEPVEEEVLPPLETVDLAEPVVEEGPLPPELETVEAVAPFIAEDLLPPEPEVVEMEETIEEAEPSPTEPDLEAPASAVVAHELAYIEGVGEVYTQRLSEAGIQSSADLLEKGATPKGRMEIAEATGISEKLILKWVNQVDLYRVKGIGSEYAELLEVAGVDTVVELAMRNPANLHQTLLATCEEKGLVRQPPTLSQVEDWVEQARNLPRVITH